MSAFISVHIGRKTDMLFRPEKVIAIETHEDDEHVSLWLEGLQKPIIFKKVEGKETVFYKNFILDEIIENQKERLNEVEELMKRSEKNEKDLKKTKKTRKKQKRSEKNKSDLDESLKEKVMARVFKLSNENYFAVEINAKIAEEFNGVAWSDHCGCGVEFKNGDELFYDGRGGGDFVYKERK